MLYRELNDKTLKQTEQYISMLHQEVDNLTSNTANQIFVWDFI